MHTFLIQSMLFFHLRIKLTPFSSALMTKEFSLSKPYAIGHKIRCLKGKIISFHLKLDSFSGKLAITKLLLKIIF